MLKAGIVDAVPDALITIHDASEIIEFSAGAEPDLWLPSRRRAQPFDQRDDHTAALTGAPLAGYAALPDDRAGYLTWPARGDRGDARGWLAISGRMDHRGSASGQPACLHSLCARYHRAATHGTG